MQEGQAHPPAEEGECLGCHLPHESEFASLLANEVPEICLDCHDGDDGDFRALHLGLSGSQIDCRKCHDPHVSDAEGLIQRNRHDPFEGNACSACHTDIPEER
jgi:predicted CXXCH cytochrome family protein